jgi:3-oxoacyl-[acyl-carrier-protein] synthase II
MAMDDALVISGLGLMTPFGRGPRRFWDGLAGGGTRLRAATAPDGVRTVCGRVALPAGAGPRRSRLLRYALTSVEAGQAVTRGRTLLVVVGQAPVAATPAADADVREVSAGWPDEAAVADYAEVTYLSQACASVFFGISYARAWIAGGQGEAAVVAGAFTLNRYECLGMAVTGAVSGDGARPFDVARDGTSLGEGSAAVLIEPASRARARGIRPLARLAGLRCQVSGRSRTDSDPAALARCMTGALREADVDLVDYVHAHATGTVQGDAAEREALDLVGTSLGWRGVPVGSHKGAVGHLMHVSGGAALAAGIGALRSTVAPGTARLRRPIETSPAIQIASSSRALPVLRTVMVNSFGFAGNSASMVLATEV